MVTITFLSFLHSDSVKKFPNLPIGWYTMCTLALCIKDYKAAEYSLTQLKQIPFACHAKEFYLLKYLYYMLTEKAKLAQNELCKGLHLFPEDLQFWNRLSQWTREMEHDSYAIASISFDLASLLCQQTPTLENYLLSSLRNGSSYSDLIQSEQTILRLNEISKLNLFFGKLGGAMGSIKTIQQAAKNIQLSLRCNPLNWDAWYLLALITYVGAILSRRTSTWEAAEQTLKIALLKFDRVSNKPDYLDCLLFLRLAIAECQISCNTKNSTDIALANSKKYLEEYKADKVRASLVHRQIARCLVASKAKFDDIYTHYKSCLNLNPCDALAWQELATLYEAKGNLVAAKYTLENAMNKLSETGNLISQFSTKLRLAHLLVNLKLWDEVLEQTNQALDMIPFSAVTFFLRGKIYSFYSSHILEGVALLKLGDMAGAEEHFQRALMLDSSLPAVNYYLSLVHLHLKDYETTDSDLHYELDNNPLTDQVYYQFGRIAAVSKKPEIAKKNFARAIRLNPTVDPYWKELEKLTLKK